LSAAITHSGDQRPDRLATGSRAVVVEGVGKAFRVPHQRYSTLKERALHPFAGAGHDSLLALDDINFHVHEGEFFGIVGRNGSGKSTLLKCLAGIYGIDSGQVGVHGRLSPFIELGVGFNPDLTARDNVVINAIMLGLTRKQANERFDEIIAFAELEEFMDLKLKNYSSGMSVRLGFSVAIQVDADILLIDEVLAVGDAAFQRKCFDVFHRMRDEGRTVLFVTHDMASVERFCDRAMLLEKGRMLALGPADEIARRYNEVNFGQVAQGGRTAVPGGEAVIRRAWCEDENGRRIMTSAQGSTCSACLEAEFLAPTRNPVFTIAFRNEVMHTIFVPSTGRHPPLGDFERGERLTVKLAFENWLAPSRYLLTPAMAVWDPDPRVLDQRDDIASLIVDGPGISGGVADLPTELSVERL
jgi:ABC-type polysaccharide/polyol phosphate transport system ATPase subunit